MSTESTIAVPTDLTAMSDLSLRGPAGKILPQLVKLIQDG